MEWVFLQPRSPHGARDRKIKQQWEYTEAEATVMSVSMNATSTLIFLIITTITYNFQFFD